jgi:hypothetical protein
MGMVPDLCLRHVMVLDSQLDSQLNFVAALFQKEIFYLRIKSSNHSVCATVLTLLKPACHHSSARPLFLPKPGLAMILDGRMARYPIQYGVNGYTNAILA